MRERNHVAKRKENPVMPTSTTLLCMNVAQRNFPKPESRKKPLSQGHLVVFLDISSLVRPCQGHRILSFNPHVEADDQGIGTIDVTLLGKFRD